MGPRRTDSPDCNHLDGLHLDTSALEKIYVPNSSKTPRRLPRTMWLDTNSRLTMLLYNVTADSRLTVH